MNVSIVDIRQRFDDLIDGRQTREAVADFAINAMAAEDAGALNLLPATEADKIWNAIIYLSGADIKDTPDSYLHTMRDFSEMREALPSWHVNFDYLSAQLKLPDGDLVVLLNMLGRAKQFPRIELARNVFRISAQGHVKWQVSSQFDADGDPFTHISLENGLMAYRWDGATYAIDLETGIAEPWLLER